jgi:hypothetical protein
MWYMHYHSMPIWIVYLIWLLVLMPYSVYIYLYQYTYYTYAYAILYISIYV